MQLNLGRAGDAPFAADLDAVLSEARQAVVRLVQGTPLPAGAPCGSPLLARLLHDHLVHTRCWRTAAIMARELAPQQVRCVSVGRVGRGGLAHGRHHGARAGATAGKRGAGCLRWQRCCRAATMTANLTTDCTAAS